MVEPKVRQLQAKTRRKRSVNRLSVRMELQAIACWRVGTQHAAARRTGGGRSEEALNAAQAIGDDRLQQQGQGRRAG